MGRTEYQYQEDSRNGMLPIPGGGNAVGDSVQATDYGSGEFLLEEAAGLGTVQGVQGGDGARVDGIPPSDIA